MLSWCTINTSCWGPGGQCTGKARSKLHFNVGGPSIRCLVCMHPVRCGELSTVCRSSFLFPPFAAAGRSERQRQLKAGEEREDDAFRRFGGPVPSVRLPSPHFQLLSPTAKVTAPPIHSVGSPFGRTACNLNVSLQFYNMTLRGSWITLENEK